MRALLASRARARGQRVGHLGKPAVDTSKEPLEGARAVRRRPEFWKLLETSGRKATTTTNGTDRAPTHQTSTRSRRRARWTSPCSSPLRPIRRASQRNFNRSICLDHPPPAGSSPRLRGRLCVRTSCVNTRARRGGPRTATGWTASAAVPRMPMRRARPRGGGGTEIGPTGDPAGRTLTPGGGSATLTRATRRGGDEPGDESESR